MTITLLLPIGILVAGLVAMFNYTRILSFLDSMLGRLGSLAQPMKYILVGLCVVLFVGAIYSLGIYYKTGVMLTYGQEFAMAEADAVAEADRLGNWLAAEEGLAGQGQAGVQGRHSSVLGKRASSFSAVDNGRQDNVPMASIPDNILTKFWLPQFTFRDSDGCSRTFKSAGNCQGISRHFRDESRTIASGCNKLYVTAPQQFPFVQQVDFQV